MPSSATPDIYPLSLHDALPISIDLDVLVRIGKIALVWTHPVADHSRAYHIGDEFVAAAIPGKEHWTGTSATIDLEDLVPLVCGKRSEEHTSELQSHHDLVCRLLLPPTSTLFPYTTLFRSPSILMYSSGSGRSRWFGPTQWPITAAPITSVMNS